MQQAEEWWFNVERGGGGVGKNFKTSSRQYLWVKLGLLTINILPFEF